MLALQNVSIQYQSLPIVRDVSLQLEKGQLGCLLGPSGSGKTSLLRAIAGFTPIHAGTIAIHHTCVSSREYAVPAEDRGVGMMFQDLALFPHLNVADNIAFGLRYQRRQRDQRRQRPYSTSQQQQRVHTLLQLVALPDMQQRAIHQLSGGQQQRVALARALAPQPDILLLDEPFSSLDTSLRQQLVKSVRAILKQQQVTALLVTHDQQEAFAFADKIAILDRGQLLQWAAPRDIYRRPAHPSVADLVGGCSFVSGRWVGESELDCALGRLKAHKIHSSDAAAAAGSAAEGDAQKPAKLLLRPEDMVIYPAHQRSHDLAGAEPVRATVTSGGYLGAYFAWRLELQSSGESLLCHCPANTAEEYQYQVGDGVQVAIAKQAQLVAY